jgi:hypothetical protein
MSYVVQSYDLTGRQIPGASGVMLAYGLKTIRGVKNRISKKNWSPQAVSLKIFKHVKESHYKDHMRFEESIQLKKPLEATEGFVPALPFTIHFQPDFT